MCSHGVEAVVEVIRAELLERGDAPAAVEHARRAVAAARAGADGLSVGILGLCRRQSSPATPMGLIRSRGRLSKDRWLSTFPTAASAALGYSHWWRPNKVCAKARTVGS